MKNRKLISIVLMLLSIAYFVMYPALLYVLAPYVSRADSNARIDLKTIHVGILKFHQDNNVYPQSLKMLAPYLDDGVDLKEYVLVKDLARDEVKVRTVAPLSAAYPTSAYYCCFGVRGWPSEYVPERHAFLRQNGDVYFEPSCNGEVVKNQSHPNP